MDIFSLRLNASLVTLSACQTGRAVLGGGDELLGLSRAFLAAGAQSLLLTHWPVADAASAQFMELFYGNMLKGMSKAKSLQEAQRKMISQEGEAVSHPFYWAPYFLVGDTGITVGS